jgi:hypothetical protein
MAAVVTASAASERAVTDAFASFGPVTAFFRNFAAVTAPGAIDFAVTAPGAMSPLRTITFGDAVATPEMATTKAAIATKRAAVAIQKVGVACHFCTFGDIFTSSVRRFGRMRHQLASRLYS